MITTRRSFLKRASATALGLAAAADPLQPASMAAAATPKRSRSRLQGAGVRVPVRRQRRQQHGHSATATPITRVRHGPRRAGASRAPARGHPPHAGQHGRPHLRLHPAMTGLRDLFSSGKAAVVANMGPLLQPSTQAAVGRRHHASAGQPLLAQRPAGAVADRTVDSAGAPAGAAGSATCLPVRTPTGSRRASRRPAAHVSRRSDGHRSVSPSGDFGFDFYESAPPPIQCGVALREILAPARAHLFEQAWVDS